MIDAGQAVRDHFAMLNRQRSFELSLREKARADSERLKKAEQERPKAERDELIATLELEAIQVDGQDWVPLGLAADKIMDARADR